MLHSPFVTKELQKPIYIRQKLKNKMNESPSRENVLAYKKKETSCLLLRRKSFKKHLESITEKGINEGELFASY